MSSKMKMAFPVLLALSLMTLSACGSKDDNKAGMQPQDNAIGNEESLDSKSNGISEGRTSGPMLPVYFDFDQAAIRPDQASRIQGNADFLNKSTEVAITIEGNCDPRGSREYNMALGERRALAAKKALVDAGVAGDRLSTVSYGAERLLLQGHDELSWAQNRRDDFVIVQK